MKDGQWTIFAIIVLGVVNKLRVVCLLLPFFRHGMGGRFTRNKISPRLLQRQPLFSSDRTSSAPSPPWTSLLLDIFPSSYHTAFSHQTLLSSPLIASCVFMCIRMNREDLCHLRHSSFTVQMRESNRGSTHARIPDVISASNLSNFKYCDGSQRRGILGRDGCHIIILDVAHAPWIRQDAE